MIYRPSSYLQATESAKGIGELYLSIRTYNRLRKMEIKNLEQIARTSPKQFLAVEGFGKKCLHEISAILEAFYSSLESRRLAPLANIVELWRPYFRHPERVAVVPYDPNPPEPSQLNSDDDPGTLELSEPFDPENNSQSQIRVEDLPISARAGNVLKVCQVRTVHDLAQVDPGTLMDTANCGRRTVKELAGLLKGYFASLPSSAMGFYRDTWARWIRLAPTAASDDKRSLPVLLRAHARPVMEVIESTIERLGTRHAAILTRRMGLSHGQSRKTLDAIGREFQLTRERVRQIVERGLKLVLRNVKTQCPNVYPSVRKFIRAQGVVSIDGVASAIPDLGTSVQFDSRACVRLLLFADQDESHPLNLSGNVWSSKEINPEFNKKVLRTALEILKGIPMTTAHLSVEVAKALRQFDDLQIRSIEALLLNSPNKLRLESTADGAVLCPSHQNNSDRRRSFIYAYIKEQGVPVQIPEIFSALQDSEPELIPDSPSRRSAISAIVNGLERDDRFAWAGSSTWGLREWGYVSVGRSVAAAALEILRASSVPLSTSQIRKELSHLYRISSAAVYAALKSSEGETVERDSQGRWRPF
jgi:Bacterial RNA polymerase, alpha chain C terminal domain/Sigma-70, region 4